MLKKGHSHNSGAGAHQRFKTINQLNLLLKQSAARQNGMPCGGEPILGLSGRNRKSVKKLERRAAFVLS